MATLRMAGFWLDPRTGILTLRRRIPARLRAAAAASGHRGETVKISLGTADRKEAQKRLPDALARWNGRLEEWERLENAEALTPERVDAITDGWAAWVRAGGNLDTGGVSPKVFSSETWERDPEAQMQMARRMRVHTDEALRLAGISATPETIGLLVDAMYEKVQLAYILAHGQAEARKPPPAFLPGLPSLEKAPERPALAVTLRGLFDAWQAVATVKPRTITETDYIVKMLERFLGHDDATMISRADLARWRDTMKAEGRTNNGWNNRLSLLRQVLRFGVDEGKLPADPTDGLRLKKSRNQSPLPYSDDDAATILLAARKETRPSLRWAHWVMAFTGMRAGEVLQLLGADVREEGGIWCIDINEHAAGKSVKTGQRRIVPVHHALIAEGFTAYAKTIAPDAPLFPDKLPDQHGNRGGRAWNVIGAWVREKVGITDPLKAPDHSWRHRVEDELRSVEVPEDGRDAILGHARRTMGKQYGVRGEALTRLHRYVGLIPVPPGVM
jgi:integrase